MGCGGVPGALAVLLTLIGQQVSVTRGRDSPEDFVIQAKADCYFTNGTDGVRFVVRFIFNVEEFAHFDSHLGVFVALTELGRPDVERWNGNPDLLRRSRAAVDTLCRRNYKLGAPFTVGRRVPPEVTVHPQRTPFPHQHNLLLCSVTGFYPGDIQVRWFRNGQEQRAGVVSPDLIRNGDWTFQTTAMLEVTLEPGDVYGCLVQHPGLPGPVSVEWRAPSQYSWQKMLGAAAAFLFGLLFLVLGVTVHMRAWRGSMETQPGDEVSRAVLPPQPH